MARYIDADALIERLLKLKVVTDDMYGMGIARGIERAETAIQMQPTADVAPKSEGEKPMFENTRNILHHLKHQIHDKAVYPHNAGIDAYITLKAFDAILQNYLNGLK